MNWFYFHCILALVILVKDYNGTLEEDLNKFEERLGIRTELPPDSTENVPPPYYINPREEREDDDTRNT
jgi:hypothetical protein